MHRCPGQLASAALFAREWQGAYSQCKPCSMNASVGRRPPARPPARTPSSRRRKSSRASRRTVHLLSQENRITFPETRWVAVFHHSELSSANLRHRDLTWISEATWIRAKTVGDRRLRAAACTACRVSQTGLCMCHASRGGSGTSSSRASPPVSLLPLYQRCARTPRCHILMSLYIWGLRSPRAVLPRVVANHPRSVRTRRAIGWRSQRTRCPPRDSACT